MIDLLLARYVYVLVVVLLAIGLYGMLAHRNLVKKIIAMLIFQTAIYVFFVEGSVKDDATAPVLRPGEVVDPADYVNPLPHLLILTAIVVGVAVVGVAFALLQRLHDAYGTLDEEAILATYDERRTGSAPEREPELQPEPEPADRTSGT